MKRKRRTGGNDELNITSMMDMMTIILVFLLKSFGASELTVNASQSFELPRSNSMTKVLMSPKVIVQRDKIQVDDGDKPIDLPIAFSPIDVQKPDGTLEKSIAFPKDAKDGGALINDLYTALKAISDQKKEVIDKMKQKMGAQADPNDLPKMGQLILMIDKEVPYQMLQEVMYTAGQAQFSEFQFVVIGPME